MTVSFRPAFDHDNSGFTLVEIAMVMFIIALLLAGLVPAITAQLEQQRTNETRRQLNEIQEALIGFAIVNGRLPCPAKAGLATGVTNAGVEAVYLNSCACTSGTTFADFSGIACTYSTVTGVLPWTTLGLKETDAWDRRFTYRVTTHFADQISNTYVWGCGNPEPTVASFSLCSPGWLFVKSSAGGTPVPVASNLPAIFLSHGKNGFGAYTSQGIKLPNGSSDEVENSDDNYNFVSHNPTSSFDDIVAWTVPGILFNRMIAAGKLP